MKHTKNLARKTALFAFTMLIAFSGMGTTLGSYETLADSALTVSASSESVTLTAQDFGLKNAFLKGEVQRVSTTISEFSFNDFKNGITFKADGTTKVILTYSDGTLVFNPITKECIENHRRSKISRDVVYLTKEDLGTNISGYGTLKFAIFSTARNPETGDHGIYLFGGNANNFTEEEKAKYVAGTESEYYLVHEKFFLDYSTIELPYVEGAEYYIMTNVDKGILMRKYDILKKEISSDYYGSRIPIHIPINEENFPDCSNCKEITVSDGYLLTNHDTDYGMTNEDGSLSFDGNEFASGKIDVSYMFELNLAKFPKIRFTFENEDGFTYYKEYYWFSDGAFLNASTEPKKPLTDENGDIVTDKDGNDLYDGTNAYGDPVVRDETIGTVPTSDTYPVTVYEGANAIAHLTKGDYEKGEYVITDANPDKNYYVKVGLDEDGKDFIVYKWNDELGAWVRRVDTTLQDKYDAPIDITTYPDEFAGGLYLKGLDQIGEFSKEDFADTSKENKLPIDVCDDTSYEVIFDYGQDGGRVYTFIGIDPEFVEEYGTNTGIGKTDIPYQADKGDTIIVDGTSEDGTPVHFETTAENGDGIDTISVPDGDYTITDKDKQLQNDFTVDSDGDQKQDNSIDGNGEITAEDGTKQPYTADVLNPDDSVDYVITTPDGKVVAEGSLDADSPFVNISELPEEQVHQIPNSPYYGYEVTSGIKNATDDNDNKAKTESGWLIINEDGSFKKFASGLIGDVNLDGVVDVKDVIFLQKYILNKNKNFAIQNAIAGDLNRDGKVNIIDLALLKQILLNK